jgi:hypothetical protein
MAQRTTVYLRITRWPADGAARHAELLVETSTPAATDAALATTPFHSKALTTSFATSFVRDFIAAGGAVSADSMRVVTVTSWGDDKADERECLKRYIFDDSGQISQALATTPWPSPPLYADTAEAFRACVTGCGGTAYTRILDSDAVAALRAKIKDARAKLAR